MRDANRVHGCFPTRNQELLLEAALMPGPRALPAWNAWRQTEEIDRLDAGSSKLLPLLHRNLQTLGVQDPVMDKLKGIGRATWCRNQVQLHHAATLLAVLRRAGIRTLLLKGAGLVHVAYTDAGLRPMEDVDLLVPTSDARRAVAAASNAGWATLAALPPGLLGAYIAIKHGFNFQDASGHVVDLHWHVMDECLEPQADAAFWAAAVPINVRGEETLTLCPADHLIHVCVHGTRWNPIPPIRWVADAMQIIRHPRPAIDWDRVADQARQRRVVMPVREALWYLAERFAAPIPAEFLGELDRYEASAFERTEYHIRVNSSAELGPWWRVRRQWVRYMRVSREAGGLARLAQLLMFLQVGLLEAVRDVLLPGLARMRGRR